MTSYEALIDAKRQRAVESGFAVNQSRLNASLFDFQRFIVALALKKGRFALFEDCGLGKTIQQLAWAEQVFIHTGKPVLILCPLAVVEQTIQEGKKFGIVVNDFNQYHSAAPGIYVTNYEQLANIDTGHFAGIVLDESSILKDFEGATRNLIIDRFRNTPYKLACTATPSPNDPMELGNHAEFLGVMTRTQMLAMYFVHDGGDTSQWRLKKHAEGLFWDWVASWSVMLSKPHDIGFDMAGYDLPQLHLHDKQIKTPKRNNGSLFNDMAVNATSFNQELRLTQVDRLSQVADIVNASDEPFIIWVKQNEESTEMLRLIPDAVEVRGDMSAETKKARLLGFAKGGFRVLVTKTKIASFGLNYQHCPNQVFASLDFSFEGLYQAIRRSYRFGQNRPVQIYLITTDTMQNVVASIRKKQMQHEKMQSQMIRATQNHIEKASNPLTSRKPIQLPSWIRSYATAC
ncbi:hypothetical protein GCM10027299_56140 [Larkinella ripae]